MRHLRHRWYCLPSPLLGPNSFKAVAAALEADGQETLVADPPMTTPECHDHIAPWIDAILAVPMPTDGLPVVVVGHSAACPRLPLATSRLLDAGWNVKAMICVDGRFPDGRGFTEADTHFATMLDGLVRPDDYLPPWPRWWGSLMEGLVLDRTSRSEVFDEARPVPRSWFDQGCPVPELPAEVRRAFLSFGAGYVESYDTAHAAGWMTYRLTGDHLHLVVEPERVASTLQAMMGCLEAGS